ncbi:hypothetical protein NTE12_002016 [Vibrio harveyi]|nr:hypothetical protein [Vibrio harveyi]
MLLSEDHLKSQTVISDVIVVKTTELLTSNRYDLVIKQLVVQYFIDGYRPDNLPEKISKLYAGHIEIVTDGKFSELSSNKSGVEDYLNSFYQLYLSISSNGFDAAKGAIPLANDGTIVNGAHRLSICLALGIEEVSCVALEIDSLSYSERRFRNLGLEPIDLDYANIKLIESVNDLYIACLWPSVEHTDESLEVFGNKIISIREICFSEVGKRNLMLHLYGEECWIGSPETEFSGLENKIMPCFQGRDKVIFVLISANSLEDVLDKKETVRDIFKIGKHALHITDTANEARLLSKLVFNSSSIELANLCKPWVYPDFWYNLKSLSNSSLASDITLVGSFLLGLLGIRKPSDMDFLSSQFSEKELKLNGCIISNHESEIRYYPKDILSSFDVGDSVCFFLGVKIADINTILSMKTKRSETKDISDVLQIKSIFNHHDSAYSKAKKFILKNKAKLRWCLLKLLKKMNIDQEVYKVYKIIQRKLK